MSVIIRLQNLPISANAASIRRFFSGLTIPEGGVHIIGGEEGDAFIAFATDDDARKAMKLNYEMINNAPVNLILSSKTEMQKVIEAAKVHLGGGGFNNNSNPVSMVQQQSQFGLLPSKILQQPTVAPQRPLDPRSYARPASPPRAQAVASIPLPQELGQQQHMIPYPSTYQQSHDPPANLPLTRAPYYPPQQHQLPQVAMPYNDYSRPLHHDDYQAVQRPQAAQNYTTPVDNSRWSYPPSREKEQAPILPPGVTDFTIRIATHPIAEMEPREVHEFLKDLLIVPQFGIRFQEDTMGRWTGYVYVMLQTRDAYERALRMDGALLRARPAGVVSVPLKEFFNSNEPSFVKKCPRDIIHLLPPADRGIAANLSYFNDGYLELSPIPVESIERDVVVFVGAPGLTERDCILVGFAPRDEKYLRPTASTCKALVRLPTPEDLSILLSAKSRPFRQDSRELVSLVPISKPQFEFFLQFPRCARPPLPPLAPPSHHHQEYFQADRSFHHDPYAKGGRENVYPMRPPTPPPFQQRQTSYQLNNPSDYNSNNFRRERDNIPRDRDRSPHQGVNVARNGGRRGGPVGGDERCCLEMTRFAFPVDARDILDCVRSVPPHVLQLTILENGFLALIQCENIEDSNIVYDELFDDQSPLVLKHPKLYICKIRRSDCEKRLASSNNNNNNYNEQRRPSPKESHHRGGRRSRSPPTNSNTGRRGQSRRRRSPSPLSQRGPAQRDRSPLRPDFADDRQSAKTNAEVSESPHGQEREKSPKNSDRNDNNQKPRRSRFNDPFEDKTTQQHDQQQDYEQTMHPMPNDFIDDKSQQQPQMHQQMPLNRFTTPFRQQPPHHMAQRGPPGQPPYFQNRASMHQRPQRMGGWGGPGMRQPRHQHNGPPGPGHLLQLTNLPGHYTNGQLAADLRGFNPIFESIKVLNSGRGQNATTASVAFHSQQEAEAVIAHMQRKGISAFFEKFN